MNKEQLITIQRKTGHHYNEIMEMDDRTFFTEITRCLATGSLSVDQHDFLNKKRTTKGLDQTTIKAIEIFDGQLVK
jgi:hypothetical protein